MTRPAPVNDNARPGALVAWFRVRPTVTGRFVVERRVAGGDALHVEGIWHEAGAHHERGAAEQLCAQAGCAFARRHPGAVVRMERMPAPEPPFAVAGRF